MMSYHLPGVYLISYSTVLEPAGATTAVVLSASRPPRHLMLEPVPVTRSLLRYLFRVELLM